MREIKFRAWDKEYKTWLQAFQISEDGSVWEPGGTGHEWTSQVELMMFTGLRDKNGKEIYEGDIVENKHCIYPNRAECYFEDGSFQFKASGCNQCDDFLANNLTTEFEVIGNIYENPELLKGAK